MEKTDIETFCPRSQQEWRQWLEENHHLKRSIWLIYYKKKSNVPTITWSDAVDEALCFGWIDSTKKSIDDHTFMQFFCQRKPNSVWSKINKTKIDRLITHGLMAPAGHKSIDTAKQNGSWTILDEVEELKIPVDLEIEFKKEEGSIDFFLGLSKSARKSILQWLVMAKREETKQKRIREIVKLAAQKLKPKQFR
ncbi:YdeI/OmpD-associated family protein [Flavobacterium sp. '19STA2R22 D10 B1']|uniref:YdeI/OmpD-associated family protein n=1 Tax=Flavobacterium aerium TaxID=3037261 RepID=UPI00278C8F0B|nr:YdeI/OmpD-associated family protein [Flavobacterium sp. '19STA2R22 D10 B1']